MRNTYFCMLPSTILRLVSHLVILLLFNPYENAKQHLWNACCAVRLVSMSRTRQH